MRRVLLLLIVIQGTMVSHGQIIVDHRAVTEFDSIPAAYLTEVKKMMVAFPGESHSEAMRYGMELLEAMDAKYASNISTAEAYTDQYVRVEDYGWIGELEWFTWFAYAEADRPYPTEVQIKHLMESYYSAGHPITALGFTWCYDMVIGEGNQTEGTDPAYKVHWYGDSIGGPDGDRGWGLDDDDFAITGNRVSLQTYFDAMEDYIAYGNSNAPGTKVVFTTGTVDFEGEWWGEGGYQGHIKHEAIRDYVKADPSKILFDYADILCHDDDGSMNTQTWNGHTYPSITSINEVPRNYGHISDSGAIRLARAQWWMLARIAGWEGLIAIDNTPPSVPDRIDTSSIAETSVSLSWTASTDDVGVAGYRIFRSGTLLGTTAELTYTDNTMASCGNFSYTVSAFDAADNESAQSTALQVNTCAPDDPGTWTENSLTAQLSIYPNPSGDHFMIDLGQASGSFTLEIIASSGSIVTRKIIYLNESPLPVSLASYPAGIYYIRVYNSDQNFSGKQVLRR